MNDEMSPLLDVKDISIAYPGRRAPWASAPPPVVRGVSFQIDAGESVGLVGESGSGKSTIGRAILGMLPVSSGSIAFDARPLPRNAAERKRYHGDVQAVFQDPMSSLNPMMSIGSTLAEPLRRLRGMDDASERTREVARLLDTVGLPTRMARAHPSELSGGQRQRVSIARAIAPGPRLIVADEAVSALDVSTRAQIVNLLADLQAETGIAYLFIAHDLSIVRHLCHRTAVLNRGELVEWGDARQVHDEPRETYTQQLVAAAPVPDPVRQRLRREARRTAQTTS